MLDLTLDELKNWLRIDGSEDDGLLTLLISAAKEDLKDSGVPESNKPHYKLAVMLYVSLHYENRDPSSKIEKLNKPYQDLILKLKDYSTPII
ncbi:head-tail connector protein [Fictibacillus sp. JL2B1089]|uniref:head-tail connector protein n=1 Tax=Fictibacillus sp. JL2B1089 TaxID=3399565 RepID=UPI003A83D37B